MLTLMAVSMIGFRLIRSFHLDLQDVLGDRGLFLLFSIPFWVLTAIRETKIAYILQILLLMAFGSVAVFFVAPRDLGGDLVFVLAGGLAYRYGLLDSRRILKLSLMMGTLILVRLVAVFVYDSINLARAANQIIIVAFTVPFLYLIFERDFLRTVKEKERLESDHVQNQPFVEFGRNVSGIVHDFKNDLALFSSFAEFLKACEWEPLEPQYVRQLEQYVGRFRRRIERLLFVTRKRGCREEEVFVLEKAVRSALYVFETSNEFRREIAFQCRCSSGETSIRSQPDELLAILENLIRNSCEALLRSRENPRSDPYDTARVEIHIEQDHEQSGIAVIVEDNGPGLTFDGVAGGEEITLDPHTLMRRHDGTLGLGLRNVVRAAERIGVTVLLHSVRDRGVRAIVHVPSSLIEASTIDV